MKRRRMKCLVIGWVLVLVSCSGNRGTPPEIKQANTGAIAGTVSSEDRDGVAKATIQLKSNDTGKVYEALTTAEGNYQVSQIPTGKYELSVTTFFYGPFSKKDIVIQTGETARVDVRLGHSDTLDTLGDDQASFAAIVGKRPPPSGPAPRTVDGKPDFSGVWIPVPQTPAEQETPEMLAWAETMSKKWRDENFKDSNSARCLPCCVELMSGLFLNRIVQTPDRLITLVEGDMIGFRQIILDKKEHPKDLDPSWTGHSIGRWDGDVLVVDTIGLNEKTDSPGPHTAMLRLTTKVRRRDLGHLETETTYEDPGAFKKPFSKRQKFVLSNDEEIQEFVCTENNQYRGHLQ